MSGVEGVLAGARRWRVEGRVQGVGFRRFVWQAARDLGLAGWVANASDGSVVAAAAGREVDLDRLAARLAAGPRASRVERLIEEWRGSEPDWAGFEIRNGE